MSLISAIQDCYETFIMHVYVNQLYFCKGYVTLINTYRYMYKQQYKHHLQGIYFTFTFTVHLHYFCSFFLHLFFSTCTATFRYSSNRKFHKSLEHVKLVRHSYMFSQSGENKAFDLSRHIKYIPFLPLNPKVHILNV